MADATLFRYPPYAADRGAYHDSFDHAAAYQQRRSPAVAHTATDARSSFFSSSPVSSPTPSSSFALPLTPLPPSTLQLPDESQQSSPLSSVYLGSELSLRWPNDIPTLPSPPPPLAPSSAPPSFTAHKAAQLTRRQKQRKADGERRRREAAALEELTHLVSAAEAYTGSGADEDAEEGEQEAARRHRAGLLESSGRRMRQLLEMIDALKQTCERQKQAIGLLEADRMWRDTAPQRYSYPASSYAATSYSGPPSVKRVRLLASAVSRSLDASLGHHALESSTFVPTALSVALVDCNTGLALDVSDAGAAMFGWQRAQVMGRPLTQKYDDVITDNWVLAQYGRSKRLKRELYAGVIDVCHLVWRMRLACGRLYDVDMTLWVDGWQSVTDADNRVVRRPLRVVAVLSSTNNLQVNDTLDRSLADE